MTWGELNVDPDDLTRVADEYSSLQTAAAAISPQAADEVHRIITTHGPMGYPVAVGIVSSMARRQSALDAKAADFGQYSERFLEHAAAYREGDHLNAHRFDALDFSESGPPAIDDTSAGEPFRRHPCWIATADGDTSACSKDTTEYVYVENGVWKNRQADNGFVSELPLDVAGPGSTLLPAPPTPGSNPFDNAAPRDTTVYWPKPDGSIGEAWISPDDGSILTTDTTAEPRIAPVQPGGDLTARWFPDRPE